MEKSKRILGIMSVIIILILIITNSFLFKLYVDEKNQNSRVNMTYYYNYTLYDQMKGLVYFISEDCQGEIFVIINKNETNTDSLLCYTKQCSENTGCNTITKEYKIPVFDSYEEGLKIFYPN